MIKRIFPAILFLLLSLFAFSITSCGSDDDPLAPMDISVKNLQGVWTFSVSETRVNGQTTTMDASSFDIDKLPLGEVGMYNYNLSFIENSLNGFKFDLSGNRIIWSLLSPVQQNQVSIIITSLSKEWLVIHYEFYNAGNDKITGYTDIKYQKSK